MRSFWGMVGFPDLAGQVPLMRRDRITVAPATYAKGPSILLALLSVAVFATMSSYYLLWILVSGVAGCIWFLPPALARLGWRLRLVVSIALCVGAALLTALRAELTPPLRVLLALTVGASFALVPICVVPLSLSAARVRDRGRRR